MARGTRPRKYRVDVWCTADELALIKDLAQATRLSNSGYLRAIGSGYQPRSKFDSEAIDKLAQLHADLGRFGGLLKLWLTDRSGWGVPAGRVRNHLEETQRIQQLVEKVITEEVRHL
jgi:hypothetical protein